MPFTVFVNGASLVVVGAIAMKPVAPWTPKSRIPLTDPESVLVVVGSLSLADEAHRQSLLTSYVGVKRVSIKTSLALGFAAPTGCAVPLVHAPLGMPPVAEVGSIPKPV